MGRMKDLLMEFCAVIYPNDYDKQDKLFESMCQSWTAGPFPDLTIDTFRDYYELHHQPPPISAEDMLKLVEKFHESGEQQIAPAMTLRKVCIALGIRSNERKTD
jgi:hypothetical protein